MTKSFSGTNDTSHLSDPSSDRGCRCGRSHPDRSAWRRRTPPEPVFDSVQRDRVYDAVVAGKATKLHDKSFVLHYAGNCTAPLRVSTHSFDHLSAHFDVRCRKCPACLRARTQYWALAGQAMTEATTAAGLRTWFGTLTFSTEARSMLMRRAREKYLDRKGEGNHHDDFEWWEDPECDYRFGFVRDEVVVELQRYWKRLRKAGHAFRYLVAIERHQDGEPHVHWLLHEQERPIRKRDLQSHWPWGHSVVSVVGGRSRKAAIPSKAAWYVVKYLSKDRQSRQIASRGYRPPSRRKAR